MSGSISNRRDAAACDLQAGDVPPEYFEHLVRRARLRSADVISALKAHLVVGKEETKAQRSSGVAPRIFGARLESLNKIHLEALRSRTPVGTWVLDKRSERVVLGFENDVKANRGTYRRFTETKKRSVNEIGTWRADMCNLTLRVTEVEPEGNQRRKAAAAGDVIEYEMAYVATGLRLKGGSGDVTLRFAPFSLDVDSLEPPEPRRFQRSDRRRRKPQRPRGAGTRASAKDVLALACCLLVPASAVMATVGRAIYLGVHVEGTVERMSRFAGAGAAIGLGLAALGMVANLTDTFERTVNLRTGEATPWRWVSRTVDGPFGEFLMLAVSGAVIGLLAAVWS